MEVSQAETSYCELTVRNGLRLDGRAWDELRPIGVELGIIAQASGSARIHLGDTDVVVGIKAEVNPPSSSHPNAGRLAVTVECSACASPDFEGRGGDAWGHALAAALQQSLVPGPSGKGGGLDLEPLCIIPGKAAWTLHVDALVLNDSGGVLAALSLAALAALSATRLPRVTVTGGRHTGGEGGMAVDGEGGEGAGLGDAPEIELEDDESGEGGVPLAGLSSVPLIVSVGLVGTSCIVDPSALEEQAAGAVLHIAVNAAGALCGITQEGPRGVDPSSLLAAMEAASAVARPAIQQLNTFTALQAAKLAGQR